MNQINPWMKAWGNSGKDLMLAAKTRASQRKWLASIGSISPNKYHRYERTFSGRAVGELRVMSGLNAKKLNEKLFKAYLRAMDRDVKGRSLERWEFVEDATREEAFTS